MNTPVDRVLLIRHGQTDWNVNGRWQGILPIGLNDIGRSQAQALAMYLAQRQIGSIYTSHLPRALDTALALGQVVGVVPQIDERLQEFNLGVFQGLTREEIDQQYPNEWRDFEANYWDYSIKNGESRRALQTRAHEVFQDIVTNGNGPEVAIVSHGGTIRTLLHRLFEDSSELNNFHIENTSLTTIERDGDAWRLHELAAVPHLGSRDNFSTL